MMRARSFLALSVVLCIALAIAGVEVVRQREASRVAGARELALHGVELQKVDPVGALLLGVIAVRVHPDARTRAALMDSVVSERRGPLGGTVNIEAAALSADGLTALTGDLRQGVTLWTLSRPQMGGRSLGEIQQVPLGTVDDGVSALALTPDGRTAVAGGYDTLSVWDLTDRARPVRRAIVKDGDYPGDAKSMALTSDGRIALIGHENGGVTVWDLTARPRLTRLFTLDGHVSKVRGVGLSADGRTAVTVSKEIGIVWDLTDRSRPAWRGTLTRPDTPWESVALSADGHTAVTGSWRGADVWDVKDRAHPARLTSLPTPVGTVDGVALTADGRKALTATFAGPTVLWDLGDRSHPIRVGALDVPGTDVNVVALNAGGRVAVVGTPQWGAMTWDLAGIGADPLRSVCADPRFETRFHDRLTRNLWDAVADEEWPGTFGDLEEFRPCP